VGDSGLAVVLESSRLVGRSFGLPDVSLGVSDMTLVFTDVSIGCVGVCWSDGVACELSKTVSELDCSDTIVSTSILSTASVDGKWGLTGIDVAGGGLEGDDDVGGTGV